MGKTKAEEIRKELNEARETKEPKVHCRHYETWPGIEQRSCGSNPDHHTKADRTDHELNH